MIAQVHISASFGDTLDYLMNPKREEEALGEKNNSVQKITEPLPAETRISRKNAETGKPAATGKTQSRKLDRQTNQPSLFDNYSESIETAADETKNVRQKEEENYSKPAAQNSGNASREKAPAYDVGARHRIIGGNLGGQTAAELRREFKAVAAQRPDIRKPVVHISLSAAPDESVPVDKWRTIGGEVVERLGLKDSPWVMIQHRDRPHDHPHIVASAIDAHGKRVELWQCKRRAEEIVREIEIKHDLKRVTPSRETLRAAPKRNEIWMFEQNNQPSIKRALADQVDSALKSSPDLATFVEVLKVGNVRVVPFFESQRKSQTAAPQTTGIEPRAVPENDQVVGVCFALGSEIMKGSNLGHGFSWNALQERGLDYQPGRDNKLLCEIKIQTGAYLKAEEHFAQNIPVREAVPVKNVSDREIQSSCDSRDSAQESPAEIVRRLSETIDQPIAGTEQQKTSLEPREAPQTSTQSTEAEADRIEINPDKAVPESQATISSLETVKSAENSYSPEDPFIDNATTPKATPKSSFSPPVVALPEPEIEEEEPVFKEPAAAAYQPPGLTDDLYGDDWYYLEYEKLLAAQIEQDYQRFQAEIARQNETVQTGFQAEIDRVVQNFEKIQQFEPAVSGSSPEQIAPFDYAPPESFAQSPFSSFLPSAVPLASDEEIHARLAQAVSLVTDEPEPELAETEQPAYAQTLPLEHDEPDEEVEEMSESRAMTLSF